MLRAEIGISTSTTSDAADNLNVLLEHTPNLVPPEEWPIPMSCNRVFDGCTSNNRRTGTTLSPRKLAYQLLEESFGARQEAAENHPVVSVPNTPNTRFVLACSSPELSVCLFPPALKAQQDVCDDHTDILGEDGALTYLTRTFDHSTPEFREPATSAHHSTRSESPRRELKVPALSPQENLAESEAKTLCAQNNHVKLVNSPRKSPLKQLKRKTPGYMLPTASSHARACQLSHKARRN